MSGKKAFLDTNLFIYLIEENDLYLNKVHNMLQFLEHNGYEIITSTLTLGEILTKPYKDNRLDLVKQYNIKTPDAVQLASAIYGNADLFVTNDDRLARFKDDKCKVMLLSKF